MKNNFKKTASMTLAIMLLFSFAAVVYAEEGPEGPPDHTVSEVVVVPVTPPEPKNDPPPADPKPADPPPADPAPVDPPPVDPPATGTDDEKTGDGEEGSGVLDLPTDTTPGPTPEAPPEVPAEITGSVAIKLHGEAGYFQYGDTIKLEAIISGYENVPYAITWEFSDDGENWYLADGENHAAFYEFKLDEVNANWGWRAAVDIIR